MAENSRLEKLLNEHERGKIALRHQQRDGTITEKELKAILKTAKSSPSKIERLPQEKVKYGVISDTHIGHKCYDSGLMDLAVDTFAREKVDFVIHGGDICEGWYSSRPGHVFELEHLGGDAQVERAVEELGKIKKPIYLITGNHEQNTFFNMCGFDIGKRIAEDVKDAHYLGQQTGAIELKWGHQIQVSHPDGGTAYAISYKPQKMIEALEGGTKPQILHIGHFHKAEYIFYRNVHAIQNGTLCRQTPFMRNKGIAAHMGFWVVKVGLNKKGVAEIEPRFYPHY